MGGSVGDGDGVTDGEGEGIAVTAGVTALATGAGAVSRRVIGTVVIGGMLAATCVAVCLVPVTFYVVERIAGSRRELKREPNVTSGGEEPTEIAA